MRLSGGLPVGLQLIGPQFSENTLFQAGHALERALDFDQFRPACDERLKPSSGSRSTFS